jgi:hypothetical protein
MNQRNLASVAALMLVGVAVGTVPQPIAAQAPSSAARSWTVPRTPDGRPNLQGIWTNATVTPLERPAELAGKEFLTDAEADEFERRAVSEVNADRRDGLAETDVGRAYNEFWRERGKAVSTRRSSLIVDPRDGRVPPLTPEGERNIAQRAEARRRMGGPFDGAENRSLAERCVSMPQAGPPMMPANYSSNYQIVQSPGSIAIVVEMIHDPRIIPLDGRPHLGKTIRQLLGDSRGRWEGDTLVVDTTNFTNRTNFRGSGENLLIVERFTRVAEDTLLYQFTVDDPTTWVRPWSGEIPMKKITGPIFEYACHEGNYGIAAILSGARAEERAALKTDRR